LLEVEGIERERRRAARADAGLLVALGVLAGVGVGLVLATGAAGPFGLAPAAIGFIALAVLCALAAIGEWNRERLSEAAAVGAAALGVVMGLVGGVAGLWYFAPVLTAAALGVALVTTHRFLVRDEARHAPSLA
jgi:hypothetical protein